LSLRKGAGTLDVMRVLVVSHAAVVPGYRDKFPGVRDLCEDLSIMLVTPRRWSEGGGWATAAREHEERYELRPLPTIGAGYQFGHLYRGLRRCLAEWRPDLIHLEEEPPSLVARQVCWLRNRAAPDARLLFFTWENLDQEWRGWRRAVYSHCERVTQRCASAAVAGTSMAAETLRRRGFGKRIFVLPQVGVDTARFAPRESERLRKDLGLRRPVVGFLGRLIPEKGFADLVTAFARLAQGTLLIVGAGPQRESLEDLAARFGVADRVVFAGAVPHYSTSEYLNCLEALVLPSRTIATWAEQFGRVLVEAMACGTPVIGSDSGAIPEVIGDAGLTFPEGDAEALACQLRLLLNDSALQERLARLGRQRVLRRFSKEVITTGLRDIYETVLEGRE